MTMAYQRYHSVDTRIVRIFNTYGPGMRPDDGRMIPAFFTQALRGEDVLVFGGGSQTRSICFVSDLVEGIYRLLQSDYRNPLNLGNPQELSVFDVALKIIALTDSRSQIKQAPLPPDDPKVRRPDIDLARRELGWYPRIAPDDGLARTLPYFRRDGRAPGRPSDLGAHDGGRPSAVQAILPCSGASRIDRSSADTCLDRSTVAAFSQSSWSSRHARVYPRDFGPAKKSARPRSWRTAARFPRRMESGSWNDGSTEHRRRITFGS